MSHSRRSSSAFRALREEAERILREQSKGTPEAGQEEFLRLVHELEVHQVELEIQNDELRRAQAELEASRNRFAELYESAPVAYVILNPKGLIQRANRAAQELLGENPEGRPFSALVLDDDLFAYYGYINEQAAQHRPEAVELRMAPRPGKAPVHVLVESALHPHADEGGPRWCLALVDITARRRTEQELEALTASLEKQVQDRTAALERSEARARDEARWRRRLADRLVELLEEDRRSTARSLHDDVGQILVAVKMQLESLQADRGDPGAEADGQLDRAVKDLQDAVARLRNVSRRLHPTSLSVLGLVAALRSLREEVQKGACRIHFFFHEVPEELDPDLALTVFRIAQEAAANAIRHAGCREIHLSLAARNNTLHLSVEDDGRGFDWEETTFEASGRDSLGLMIMQARAIQADGDLRVETSPGKGTTVTAEIPLKPRLEPEEIRRP
ncbi:MAG: PAS domain S-box protein [Deltaproteobacteria bacterium]|nr:PAS domain S-box protein [Deltaproteobacteria bacterium]